MIKCSWRIVLSKHRGTSIKILYMVISLGGAQCNIANMRLWSVPILISSIGESLSQPSPCGIQLIGRREHASLNGPEPAKSAENQNNCSAGRSLRNCPCPPCLLPCHSAQREGNTIFESCCLRLLVPEKHRDRNIKRMGGCGWGG